MKLSPEVLIYIQTIKTYFKNNVEAREYFLSSSDEESFFRKLSLLSQKNFDEDGDEKLSRVQFESLREVMHEDFENKVKDFMIHNALFFEVPNFGVFSLN